MLVQADASQLEWRVAVDRSRDPVALKELLSGADIHSINQQTFLLPSRLISKIYLFRTIFRGSGYSFSVDPNFRHVSSDPDFWDDVNRKFYSKYYGLDRQHHKDAETVITGKPLVGPTGRTWFIPYEDKIPWTKLTNSPVQGTGADIMAVARVEAHRLNDDPEIKFISTVHDSVVADVPEDKVDKTVEIFYNAFNALPRLFKERFNYDLALPFPCECKIGFNLTEMEKV